MFGLFVLMGCYCFWFCGFGLFCGFGCWCFVVDFGFVYCFGRWSGVELGFPGVLWVLFDLLLWVYAGCLWWLSWDEFGCVWILVCAVLLRLIVWCSVSLYTVGCDGWLTCRLLCVYIAVGCVVWLRWVRLFGWWCLRLFLIVCLFGLRCRDVWIYLRWVCVVWTVLGRLGFVLDFAFDLWFNCACFGLVW